MTLAVAKKSGTNAVDLVTDLDRHVARLEGAVIPGDVSVTETRGYGCTADEKSSELIKHFWIATLVEDASQSRRHGRCPAPLARAGGPLER